MDNQTLFRLLDAVKARPGQLLEYAKSISKESPLSIVLKHNENFIETRIITDEKTFVGVIVGDVVIFGATLSDKECSYTDLSVKDVRSFAALVHPKAKPVGLPQLCELIEHQEEWDIVMDNLAVYGYNIPKIPASFMAINEANSDDETKGEIFNALGVTLGQHSLSYYTSFNEFLFYCNVDEL